MPHARSRPSAPPPPSARCTVAALVPHHCTCFAFLLFVCFVVTSSAASLRFYATPYKCYEGDAVRFLYVDKADGTSIPKADIISQCKSKRRDSAGGQTAVENLPVNTDALSQQFVVALPQVPHQTPAKTGFKNTHAAHDRQPARLGQSPGGALVNDGQVSPERKGQQHRGQFSRAQGVLGTQAEHLFHGSGGMTLDPGRRANGFSGRAPRPAHDHFLPHFVRNVDLSEELPEQVKQACPREGDERGGIGNDDHNLRRAAVARSSSRSSAV